MGRDVIHSFLALLVMAGVSCATPEPTPTSPPGSAATDSRVAAPSSTTPVPSPAATPTPFSPTTAGVIHTPSPTPVFTHESTAATKPTPGSGTEAELSPFDEGIRLAESGELEKAVDAYSRAITLDPQDAKAHYNRGIVYFNLAFQEQPPENVR